MIQGWGEMVTDRVVPVFGSGNWLAAFRWVAVLSRCARGGTGSDRAGEETDYARFVDVAHQQLNGPVVLVWDNLSTHVSRAMRELVKRSGRT